MNQCNKKRYVRRGKQRRPTQVFLEPELRRAAGIVAKAQRRYTSFGGIIRIALQKYLETNHPGVLEQAAVEAFELQYPGAIARVAETNPKLIRPADQQYKSA